MRIPKVKVIFDRKHQSSDTIPGTIEIRVTMNHHQYYISTAIKVFPKDFNESIERVSVMKRRIERYINDCIEREQPIDPSRFKTAIEEDDNANDFLDFINERKDLRPCKASTKKRYDVLLNKLDEYGKIRKFSDLTTEAITLFDEYLHQHNYVQGTIYSYHKNLKLFCNEAFKFGKISMNPYQKFERIARGEKEVIDFLTEEEMQRLMTTEMPSPYAEHCRDLFVFQTWTALSYSDLAKFNFSDYDLIDGRYFRRGTRTKTGKAFANELLDPAMEILRKYNFKLPIMCNADYNKGLKMVAAYAGIKKNLHSHMARSTFATFALYHGASPSNVSVMLGHTSPRVTMKRYAKILPQSVMADLNMINDKLKEKREPK